MSISKAIIDAGTMGALGNKPENGTHILPRFLCTHYKDNTTGSSCDAWLGKLVWDPIPIGVCFIDTFHYTDTNEEGE